MARTSAGLRTVGVVLAGGVGTRVGLSIPKQLLKIAGKPVIEHTLAAFDAAPEVDDVIVLMTPDHIDEVKALVAGRGFRKVSAVIEGGRTRNDSTRNAIAHLGDGECNVLFHDAVRPLVSQRIIRECVNALRDYEAVDVGIASADTIVVVDENDVITDIPDRSKLRRGQTPQAFRLSTIRRAYELAWQDPDFAATDDCSVVLRYLPEVPIHMVEGSDQNMKVTAPVDLFIADKLFQLGSAAVDALPNKTAYIDALRGRVAVVFGGSYGIGADVVSLLESYGATVHSFSRSATGTDVGNPDDIRVALEAAHSADGRIDYVVVTAGVLTTGALANVDDATVEESIAVNFVAPVQIARLGVGYLEETKGQLLLFTSSSYTRGRAGYSLYSSTKAAVVNLTQALADEWLPLGVRVNCVNPERTATPMRERAFGAEPASELLDPAEVARSSVDVLVSSITGQVIDVRRELS
ncbi:MAG TPA: 2-C-methyl-D-erythritol 4-phosphate cytidylyltransferase [Mycobacteriales bacterium]|jgi:2-C-methyl-D-erythritol 4-phosphate cytidylyltransferase|nr:2-C-methyl-D-erythritol 4-phosphate cytidylyltransferase [Mycobacteriales bacterium]